LLFIRLLVKVAKENSGEISVMSKHFNTAPGYPQTRRAVNDVSDEVLRDFMAQCDVEPANFERCLACYAYQVMTERTGKVATPYRGRRMNGDELFEFFGKQGWAAWYDYEGWTLDEESIADWFYGEIERAKSGK
jgi:hypothetical protein